MPFDPSFDQSLADEICSRIAGGRELGEVCKDKGMPSETKVMEWSALHPAFKERLARANEQMLATRATQVKPMRFGEKIMSKLSAETKLSDMMNRQMDIKLAESYRSVGALSAGGIKIMLFVIAAVYTFLILYGLNRFVNFLPSRDWVYISMGLGLALGMICHTPATIFMSNAGNNATAKSPLRPVFYGLIGSFLFYILLAYGVGPAATALCGTLIEKDIHGVPYYSHSRHGLDDYYINTPDLPDYPFSYIHLSENEFNQGTGRMHVTFKQSFFGLLVEHYSWTKNH